MTNSGRGRGRFRFSGGGLRERPCGVKRRLALGEGVKAGAPGKGTGNPMYDELIEKIVGSG